MNSKDARTKVGKLDMEVNTMSKYLFIAMVMMAFGIVGLKGFRGEWWISLFRFILLLCSIIPISLRVNLDMAKIYYCRQISQDESIPDTIPRTSTIPEDLGRI